VLPESERPAPLQTSGALGRGRLTDQAYGYIRDGIQHGRIPTGSVLAETEIARTLGISRTPVRHALSLLLREGLVEIGARRQVTVRGFTAAQRDEILLLREALEGVAVRQACEVLVDDDIDYLRLLILRQKRAAQNGDEDAFLDLDEEFHLRIVDAARLPILYSVLGQLRGFVRVARLGQPRPASVLTEICEEHGQIVDALERRDAREAQRALVAHLHRRTGDEA
jgi:GntR family transcriptional regulator, rspAB operon transcriptional repressor